MKVRSVEREVAIKFLKGKKMDVDRAHKLLTNYQNMIRVRHFEKVTVKDVAEELRTGKMYIPGGTDRNGAQIVVIDATKHDPTKFSHEETIRLAFYTGQKATENPAVWDHGLTLLVNMSGYTWVQWDLALQRQILSLFTENIPARVKNILLFDPPWWIATIVRLVSPFLKEKMRNRLQIVNKDRLRNFIDATHIPIVFGGNCMYDHEAFVAECAETERQKEDYLREMELGNQETREATVQKTPEMTMEAVLPAEEARLLESEREKARALIAERLQQLKESVPRNKLTDSKDFINLLRYRSTRLSIDMSLCLNTIQPPRPPPKDGEKPSPIEEVPGESYEPEVMRERMRRDIEARIAERNPEGGFGGSPLFDWKDDVEDGRGKSRTSKVPTVSVTSRIMVQPPAPEMEMERAPSPEMEMEQPPIMVDGPSPPPSPAPAPPPLSPSPSPGPFLSESTPSPVPKLPKRRPPRRRSNESVSHRNAHLDSSYQIQPS